MSDTPRTSDKHEIIYVMDLGDDGEPWGESSEDTCWCEDDIYGNGRKYIRADVAEAKLAEARKLLELGSNHRDELETNLAEAQKENTILRGLIQTNANWKCTYGHQVDGKPLQSMGQCPLGFPGCSCSDDLLCAVFAQYEDNSNE